MTRKCRMSIVGGYLRSQESGMTLPGLLLVTLPLVLVFTVFLIFGLFDG